MSESTTPDTSTAQPLPEELCLTSELDPEWRPTSHDASEVEIAAQDTVAVNGRKYITAITVAQMVEGYTQQNARMICAAWNSYQKHFGDRTLEEAEADALGEALASLKALHELCDQIGAVAWCNGKKDVSGVLDDGAVKALAMMDRARAVLAKAKGGAA